MTQRENQSVDEVEDEELNADDEDAASVAEIPCSVQGEDDETLEDPEAEQILRMDEQDTF